MSDFLTGAAEPEGPTDPWEAVEAVLRSGYFDGMLRRLHASFPDLPQQAIEDAVYGAAEKCARQPRPPDNVRAWLFAVARNLLRDASRRKRSEPYDPEDPEQDKRRAPSAEDEAFPDDAYRTVVKHVGTWPGAKTRAVLLLWLEAAHQGEPLSDPDLAEAAGALLGEAISPGTAAVLKSRGRARLRAEYPLIFPDH